MRQLTLLLVPFFLLLQSHQALASTQVEVIDTAPAGSAITLAAHQNFYLRLRYTSDTPTRIWARPFFQGKAVNAGSNTSREYPTGSGEAFGWFFLSTPGVRVDEVRISAGDGSINGTPVVARYPVSVISSNTPATNTPDPEWVSTFLAENEAAQKADYQQRMNTPVSNSDIALFNGFMLTMYALGLLGIGWPAWALWRWRNYWRLAAAIPGVIVAFVVLRIIIDTARDSTSHNLWPFEIVIWCGLSSLWMLMLSFVRRLVRRGDRA